MELAIQRGNAVCDPAGGVCLDDSKSWFFAGGYAQYFAICFYHDFLNKPVAFEIPII